MHGLFRRGGTWWARLVVPQRLRAVAGRREFQQSTRAHDLRVAKAVGAAMLARWRLHLLELDSAVNDDQLSNLLVGSPKLSARTFLSLREAAALAGLSESDLLHEVAHGNLSLWCRVPPDARHGYVMPKSGMVSDGPDAWTVPNEPPPEAVPQDMGGRVLRLPDGGPDVARALLARRVNVVELVVLDAPPLQDRLAWVPDCGVRVEVSALEVHGESVDRIRQRWATSVTPERREALERAGNSRGVPALVQAVPRSAGPWADRPYSAVVDNYCSSADGLLKNLDSPKEVLQRRKTMHRFAELVGDKPIGQVTSDDLRQFRRWLGEWPAKMNTLPVEHRRATMPEMIAAVAEALPTWPKMSAGMVEERFAWLSRLFDWLALRQHLAENPAAPLKGEGVRTKAQRTAGERRSALSDDDDEEGRRSYTPHELGQIFGQPQFKSGNGRHVRGNAQCQPWEYWAPLLALLHGLRLGEVTQLWLDDIREVDGLVVFDVNDSSPDKRVKNATSRRVVPVHPVALGAGLLEYRDALRAAGYRRVFPELRWLNPDDRYRKEVGRKFSAFLKELGYARDGTITFHCARHSANGAISRVPSAKFGDMDEGLRVAVRYRLMGHALPDGDVNARHYLHVKIPELHRLVQAMEFEGLPEIARFNAEWGLESVARALKGKSAEFRGAEDCGPG